MDVHSACPVSDTVLVATHAQGGHHSGHFCMGTNISLELQPTFKWRNWGSEKRGPFSQLTQLDWGLGLGQPDLTRALPTEPC